MGLGWASGLEDIQWPFQNVMDEEIYNNFLINVRGVIYDVRYMMKFEIIIDTVFITVS